MNQPSVQADWLCCKSQQHFQKLASLAVRAEGAQQMGKLAAHREFSIYRANISEIGGISKEAWLGSGIAAGKSALKAISNVVRGGKTVASAAPKGIRQRCQNNRRARFR